MGFSALYEQSLQELRSGEIVIGRVVQVSADLVMVDVGSKTEGMIPARELRDANGNITVNVGDEIEVLVERRGEDDSLILSRDKAARIKTWGSIKEKFDNGQPIEGTITQRVKGGLTVDIGIPAFLPGSQVDIRPVRDLDRFVGQTMQFNILKYDRDRNNVVLSRRPSWRRSASRNATISSRRSRRGRSSRGSSRTSPTTVSSSTWAASTGFCTSPTFPGARCRSPRRPSAGATRSR